jgi:hypothetical protein
VVRSHLAAGAARSRDYSTFFHVKGDYGATVPNLRKGNTRLSSACARVLLPYDMSYKHCDRADMPQGNIVHSRLQTGKHCRAETPVIEHRQALEAPHISTHARTHSTGS